MSDPAAPSPPPPLPPSLARGFAAGLIGGAVTVAVVTVVARVVGLGRWVVFSKTVGGGCLADAYNTANLVPNVLFEVVAGGALAGAVVPVLAGAVARSDRAAVDRTVSALLSWTLALLVPVSLLLALLARPVVRFLLGDDVDCPGAVDAGTRMLLMFTPQLICYGLAVVLGGTLQAHRRFLAAAAAPLVSSVVVIGAYLAFVALADGERAADAVPRSAEAALAVGTTLGVVAMAIAVAVPIRSAGVSVRPTLTFPPGVLPQVRRLAGAGLAVLLAQQGALVVIALLANHAGDPGALTAYVWSWAVYLVPYAVLAVPIATSAFPRLAAAAEAGEAERLARLTAGTTRAVLVAAATGAALVAAAAVPASRVFASNGGSNDPESLAAGIAAFAPGLVGYGLVAHLTRVLYAGHHARAAARAATTGWAVVVVADVALVAAVADRHTVLALGIGNAIGMTVAAGLLLVAVVHHSGRAAVAGLPRTAATALLGGLAGAAVGAPLGARFDDAGFVGGLLGTAACAALAGTVLLAVVALGDRGTFLAVRAHLRPAATPTGDDISSGGGAPR
ncbi:murein biosynthesis integral membrane protein MurJ [Sporichthya polymorpha]|uniref:murein biosynthesis integral membrane protein MurJ n=1 Tax=Sporichthya polymorpha TaxID=35751 RepID=UPI00036ED655|nr:lipid II flippase MurJ [Sporichthya polymorpha]